jgi:putative isomerase
LARGRLRGVQHPGFAPSLRHQTPTARLEVHPDASGAWEIALDEFVHTWHARERRTFDASVAEVEAELETWHRHAPADRTIWLETRALALYVNWSSIVRPCGHLKRPTMLMSKNWMSSVWSWDHCFNALALASFEPRLAWDQMLVMSDHQNNDGLYPDFVNDAELIFNFSKPPVHGLAVFALLERSQETPGDAVLHTMYASLQAWTTWWLTHRRFSGQRLPHYLHGNDSGWDNSTMFDTGVPLIAPDLAAFLVTQLEALELLATKLGMPHAAADWRRQANELLEALLEELWDGSRFVAKRALSNEISADESLQYCLPIVLGERLPRSVCEALATKIKVTLTPHGLPTEPVSSPKYERDGYWRGPIWAPSTYLICIGLERAGYLNLALEIARRFCAMCDQHGFAENFDAQNGVGLRDRSYTWTSSVFLLLAQQLEGTPLNASQELVATAS